MSSREYAVVLTPEEGGGYSVAVPALPGCVSQGESRDQALAMIREAIEAYLESLEAHGELLEAELTADGILLLPQKLVDATQAWFWSPEWQAGEREADADRAAGKIESFSSGEEFIDALDGRTKSRKRRSSS